MAAPVNKFAEKIELVGKVALVVIFVAYGLGFAILNVHLGALGVFSVELVRGR